MKEKPLKIYLSCNGENLEMVFMPELFKDGKNPYKFVVDKIKEFHKKAQKSKKS